MEMKLSSITDFLNEQSWFQELKGKWEELDPQSRLYLKFAGIIGTVLLLLFLVISSLWSVHSLKRELSEKSDLLTLIQSANDEMRRLRETGAPPAGADQGGNWDNYFDSTAGNAGIEKGSMTVSPEKPLSGSSVAKESAFELALKHSTIRQVVKFAFFLENGNRPVRLRSMSIDTGGDPSGYLDATLAVSAFSIGEEKKK